MAFVAILTHCAGATTLSAVDAWVSKPRRAHRPLHYRLEAQARLLALDLAEPGPLIVAVPERNVVVFTRIEPKQNIELLKHRTVLAYEKAGERALSRTVLAWRERRWEGEEAS